MTLASGQGNVASKMHRAALVVAIVALSPLLAAAQDERAAPGHAPDANTPEAAVVGSCQPVRVKFMASPMTGGEATTTLKTFVNIPEASLGIVQGGTGPTCVIVEFSALAYAAGSDKMAVRALLNDTTTAQPGEMVIATNDNAANRQSLARGANFVFALIEPGSHVLRMQYRSITGGAVKIGRHTTIVHTTP